MTWPLLVITATTAAGIGIAALVLIVWPRDPGIFLSGLLTAMSVECGPMLGAGWLWWDGIGDRPTSTNG